MLRGVKSRFALWLLATSSVWGMVAAVACGGTEKKNDDIPLEDEDGGGRRDARADREDPLPDGGKTPGRVYGHSASTLYLFDPGTKQLTTIGRFDCLVPNDDEIIDIAVTRTGEMYATTYERFLTIDPLTAHCTLVANRRTDAGSSYYPNSLSFVPGPAKEILVGYAQRGINGPVDDYVELDLTTGVMTHKGDLNPPGASTLYESSGDIVSLIRDGNRTYVTIKRVTGATNDLLAEIDPANGRIKQVLGSTSETEIYGLGYWGGKGYGFTSSGRLVEIDMNNGASSLVLTLTGDAGAIPWFGAGVTTDAPTVP